MVTILGAVESGGLVVDVYDNILVVRNHPWATRSQQQRNKRNSRKTH